MKCLIIIPAYNEADNIEQVVDKIVKEYPEYDYIVVNDGSKDKTADICKKRQFNMLNLPINCGLAGAFQAGIKYAYRNNYDCAIQYDGDGQHNPMYIDAMMKKMIENDDDIVIGSRFVDMKKHFSFRVWGNSLICFCIFITTGVRIKDSTSGMRLYNRRMINRIARNINFGPEPDTVAFLIRCGAKVEEIQVTMNERTAGESYINFTGAIKYMIKICSSILFLQWFRKKEI